jgi:endo-1,4-beta-D-glucanase Y
MKTKEGNKLFSLLLFLTFITQVVRAQINTPSPTIPLNANTSYPFATILPTNAVAADATNAYNTWKTQYIASCGTTPAQYRVKFDDPTYTVSEGIGYGMLLAAYAGDKDLFDGLWTYYKASSDANGLMNWKRQGCSPNQSNAATDADEDAAMALVVAEYQWPALNSPYDYKAEANTIITNINRCEIDKNTTPQFQPSAGDGWISCNASGNNCRNPSYMAPAYYKCWSTSPYITSPQPTCPWSTVVTTSLNLVNANVSSKGLVTNWSDQNGVTNGCNGPSGEFGYDASRNPWRMATYAAWYGDASAITICNNLATSTQAATPALVGGPVNPTTNNPTGTHNATFVSMLAAGTFGSTTGAQTHINAMYSQVLSTVDAGAGTANPSGYFGNTLRVISIFFGTKNFWNPCNAGPPPATCRRPSLGSDISTCGSSFPYTLNSNTPTASGVTFTWKRITPSASTLVTASSTQNTFSVTSAMGAGTYAVIRDSTGGCTGSDTLVISSVLPSPVISPAGPINLCNPATINFTVSNAASFPVGTTWQWYNGTGATLITGATTTSLNNVRTAATYKVIASISGCASTSDQEVVTSSLPTPVDGCASSGNIPLSITNAGTGPYQWYNVATGGSSLATGTSYSAPSPGTYYVQDMSAVSLIVGPTTSLSTPGGANGFVGKGASTGQLLNFTTKTSNVTIDYVTVYVITYAATNLNFTIQLYDNAGTAINTGGSPSAAAFTGVASSSPAFTAIRVPVNITISTAGNYKLGIGLGAGDNGNMWYYQGGTAPSWASYTSSALDITGNSTSANDYSYMYKWEISTGTACARLPVIATNSGCSTSPVRLISFYASNETNNVILNWATATEINNDYFKVERSVDGYTFSGIGNINGAGNSNSVLYYSWQDPQPVFGASYYRLVQYDYDGTWEFSPVISVARIDKTSIEILPNPFNQTTNIHIGSGTYEKVQIKVIDLRGQVLYSSEQHSTNENISVGEDFSAGMYIVQVIVNGKLYHTKMIKGN